MGFRVVALLSVLLSFLVAGNPAWANFTELQFGQYQVADSQWNVNACTTTTTCEIYSMVPGTAYEIPFTNGQVNWGVNGDRYISFVPNMTGVPATQDATNPWQMVLYEADGTEVQVLGTGTALTAGEDADGNSYFFFVGSDGFTGQLFSGTYGLDSTAGVTFTGTLNPTVEELNTFSTGLSTQPLAAGTTVADVAADVTGTVTAVPQTVLERVLGLLDATAASQLNGVYANVAETLGTSTTISTIIDGSVANAINGVSVATAEAIAAATEASELVMPTINIGDIATTALGAVNTGDITVGVNSTVDEANTATTRAIQASMVVIGGSASAGTIMLNVAHNASSIQGNVQTTLIAVNGSVGNISTTALGAVNTGTIVNGIDAAVQGIVGMSGQTSF